MTDLYHGIPEENLADVPFSLGKPGTPLLLGWCAIAAVTVLIILF